MEQGTLEAFIEGAREYLAAANVQFFVKPLVRPDGLDTAERFISQRGKRDLPPIQFGNNPWPKTYDPSMKPRVVEMQGTLHFHKGEIVELAYAHPDNTRVHWGHGRISEAGNGARYDEAFHRETPREGKIILYHSHPDSNPRTSVEDLICFSSFTGNAKKWGNANRPTQDFLFPIYLPAEDRCVWYGVEENPDFKEEAA